MAARRLSGAVIVPLSRCARRPFREWQKYSCASTVVFQQPTQALSVPDCALRPTLTVVLGREQQNITLALVISFSVIVLDKLDRCAEDRAPVLSSQLLQDYDPCG